MDGSIICSQIGNQISIHSERTLLSGFTVMDILSTNFYTLYQVGSSTCSHYEINMMLLLSEPDPKVIKLFPAQLIRV